MRVQANKRREVEFQVGDWVYLKIQPIRLRSLAKKGSENLAPVLWSSLLIGEKGRYVAYNFFPG